MRFTKIVCTMGPSSKTAEHIRALGDAGMNVARINFSHGSHEEHGKVISFIRAYNDTRRKVGQTCIAIILDTKGAEIRTGDVEQPILITKGDEVVFTSRLTDAPSGKKVIQVNYGGFGNDVRETDRILIDNGEITFDILRIDTNGVVNARAKQDGKIGSRRHINLPGADVDLPSLTEQDWKDIEYGITLDMDFVALSFIRNRDDIESVRTFLQKRKSKMEIIAKIETQQAVDNIVEIIHARSEERRV